MNARNPYFTPLEEYHQFIRGHPAPIAPNDPDPDDPVVDNILFAQPPDDADWGSGSVHSDDTGSSIYSLEGGFVEELHARNLPCAGACEDCAGPTLLPEGVMHRFQEYQFIDIEALDEVGAWLQEEVDRREGLIVEGEEEIAMLREEARGLLEKIEAAEEDLEKMGGWGEEEEEEIGRIGAALKLLSGCAVDEEVALALVRC